MFTLMEKEGAGGGGGGLDLSVLYCTTGTQGTLLLSKSKPLGRKIPSITLFFYQPPIEFSNLMILPYALATSAGATMSGIWLYNTCTLYSSSKFL
jgi:hypothetical protein